MDDIINFIKNSPFAAVLWELQNIQNNEEFVMIAYNDIANSFDTRDFENYIGEPYLKNFSEAPEIQNSFFKALNEGKSIQFADFEHSEFRDETNSFRIWIIPINKKRVVILYQNITSEKRELIYSETRKLNEKLKVSNYELEQYAHLVAHDFRSPIRIIGSYIDLLKSHVSEDEDKIMKYIGHIKSNIVKMNEMISGFLEISKINGLNIRFRHIDISKILNFVIMEITRDMQDLENKIHIIESESTSVLVNEALISQLLKNLIENGVKFSRHHPMGPKIDIFISVNKSESDNNRFVLIEIKDNGIGIEEDKLIQIFQPLVKLNPEEHYSGLGLGLAICKKIVEVHNGKIWAISNVNKGSTFFVKLPLD